LVDIVAKGGNLLLNIAPGPEGQWHDGAYEMLRQIGEWMDVNSEAIYGTRAMYPFKEDNICFTKGGDGSVYAIYLLEEEVDHFPAEVKIGSVKPGSEAVIEILGYEGKLNYKQTKDNFIIMIPANLQKVVTTKEAITFKIYPVE
jgi:alpha-L-fucosidase